MTVAKTSSGKYVVKSERTGKTLSKPTSKAGAEKRLRQIEYWKNHKK